jgi:hypothetical protein
VPSGGPFEALALARELEPRLVASRIGPAALSAAIRRAFELPAARTRAYRERAAELLEPYRDPLIQARVAGEVVPRLLG